MIYYKKKSWIKKIKNKILDIDKSDFKKFMLPVKMLFFSFLSLIFVFYLAFVFLMPKYLNTDYVVEFLNNYVFKQTNLVFEAQNLKINSNYKLDVNLKADFIKLKYNSNKEILVLSKPDIDISTIALFKKYLDLNKIKVETIHFNTVFQKNNKYDFVSYINLEKKESKIKLRKIHLSSRELFLNLYDENLKKNFSVVASKAKLILDGENKPIKINASGKILTDNKKLSDFVLSLELKLRKKTTGEFRKKLLALNYNPFSYADKLAFKSFINVNLKSYNVNEKNHLDGEVSLKNYSFVLENKRLPENNLLMKFKGDKIFVDSNFNLIKNQFVKIIATVSYSKNKFIDARLTSNEINLEDFIKILGGYGKILNSKINYDDFILQGKIDADLHLKSNFREINSKGKLQIKDAYLFHKKTGLELTNIASDVNLANNKINILNTSALIGNSKFYLAGIIDEKTNLNLKMHSEEINIAKVINFLKSFSVAKKISPFLDNNIFNSGNIKIDSEILGVLKNPIIKTKTKLTHLKFYSKKIDSNLIAENILITANPEKNKIKNALIEINDLKITNQKFETKIPYIKLDVNDNDIKLHKTKGKIFNLDFDIEGLIKNYKNKNLESNFALSTAVLKNNDVISIKDVNAKINSGFTIKQNRIFINKFELINNLTNEKLAFVLGSIVIGNKENVFDNLKLLIPNNISLMSLKFKTEFIANGSLNFSGNISKPSIVGKFNITDFLALNNNLKIQDSILQINDNNIYLNVLNGMLSDSAFNLVAQAKYFKKELEISSLEINSNYLNISKISNILKQANSNISSNKMSYFINHLKGNVDVFETDAVLMNSLKFEGGFKKHILNISDFSAQMYGGNISGSISSNLLNDESKLQIVLKGIDVRSLSQAIKDFSIAASGKLSALIDAKIIGFDFNSIIKTFDGYVKFNIDDGELSQLAKFERFLQAGNILSQSILKLSLNSAMSLISKQNTGEFKTIEGTVKISDAKANIQYIKTQGTNMSLYLSGSYFLLTQEANLLILGRIPTSTVNILGNIGKLSLNDSVEKMSLETKTIIKTITTSPLEKLLSQKIPLSELQKIPDLAYRQKDINTREFVVNIFGDVGNISSIKSFKWAIGE